MVHCIQKRVGVKNGRKEAISHTRRSESVGPQKECKVSFGEEKQFQVTIVREETCELLERNTRECKIDRRKDHEISYEA